jgi:hypothetical protein
MILIQRSSTDNEDKLTNVRSTSSAGIAFLTLSIMLLVGSRIGNISQIQQIATGHTITFGQETVMFLSSFVLVFCSAFLGVTAVFGRHLIHDQKYVISIGLLTLSVIISGFFSSRVQTFDGVGIVLLVLAAGLVVGAGVTLKMVSISQDTEIGEDLKTSFGQLPIVAWTIGGFTILSAILFAFYKARKGNQSVKTNAVGHDEEYAFPEQNVQPSAQYRVSDL